MSTLLPEGFTCECGKYHEFGVYVSAYWDLPLIHTCECGRQHTVQRGYAALRAENAQVLKKIQ